MSIATWIHLECCAMINEFLLNNSLCIRQFIHIYGWTLFAPNISNGPTPFFFKQFFFGLMMRFIMLFISRSLRKRRLLHISSNDRLVHFNRLFRLKCLIFKPSWCLALSSMPSCGLIEERGLVPSSRRSFSFKRRFCLKDTIKLGSINFRSI